MEWVESLKGQLIGLDTAPFIYHIEENPKYIELVRPFFEAIKLGQIRVATSVITLSEVLVTPIRRNDEYTVQRFRRALLEEDSLTTKLVSVEIAELAAELRARHRLRTPDAIQVATTITEGVSAFVTNDARLANRGIDLRMIVLEELLGNPVQ